MRIIAGKYKARQISMPAATRPTKDKVREALFNVLGPYIKGLKILDLFAGSGSLGIEALSRGGASAVFVDSARASTKVIEKNLEALGLPKGTENVRVLTRDVRSAMISLYKSGENFDIIFIDPPYYKNWIRKCLKYNSVYDILAPSGLIIAEHFKKDKIPQQTKPLKLIRQLAYGDTVISIYKKVLSSEFCEKE